MCLWPGLGCYLSATEQSVLHDGDELLVTEFAVAVSVEQLEHDVHHVAVEQLPGACLHRTPEITFTQSHRVPSYTVYLTALSVSNNRATFIQCN